MFNFRRNSNKDDFKFKEPENTACITCRHVIEKERPILYVTHDIEDGSWQFMCGMDDHTTADAKIVSLKNITSIDLTVNDLFEMPLGFGAERKSITAKWEPFKT